MSTHKDDPRIAQYLRLPWRVRVSRDEDNGFVATVDEMPDAIGTGATAKELEHDFWQAMRASIAARLALGEPIPCPPVHSTRGRVLIARRMTEHSETVGSGGAIFATA